MTADPVRPRGADDRDVDDALIASQDALPGLRQLLDDDALRCWAARRGWALPPGARVDRVRVKHGTSARAVLDPGDGSSWWLLHAFSPASWAKHRKDLMRLRPEEDHVDAAHRLLAVPASGDRRLRPLRRMRPDSERPVRRDEQIDPLLRFVSTDCETRRALLARTISHNPSRRWVGELRSDPEGPGQALLKVHRGSGTAERATLGAALLRDTGIRVAAPGPVSADGRLGVTAWVSGRAVGPRDAGDVDRVIARMPRAPLGLPPLTAQDLHVAVAAAVDAVAAIDPARGTAVTALGQRWAARAGTDRARPHLCLEPDVAVHGDLGPDQVLVDDAGPVLLDLDRVARGPRGWDAASWWAASLADPAAAGGFLPGHTPPPLLLAAAALVRAPEPWRRRREGRAAALDALLDLADAALGER